MARRTIGCWFGVVALLCGYLNICPAQESSSKILWTLHVDRPIGWPFALGKDGAIYVSTTDLGQVIAVNTNRTIRWSTQLGGIVNSQILVAGDGGVYLLASDRQLYALSFNGAIKWKTAAPGNAAFGRLILGRDGNSYGAFGRIVAAISPSGEILWERTFPTEATAPLVSPDGTVYVGADSLYALKPDGSVRWELDLGRQLQLGYAILAFGPDGAIHTSASSSAESGDFHRPHRACPEPRWHVQMVLGLWFINNGAFWSLSGARA